MAGLLRRWQNNWLAIVTVLFFLAYLLVGLIIYDDYGMHWDDPIQHFFGQLQVNYAIRGDPTLLKYGEALYGPIFEIGLIAAEKTLRLQSSRDVYLLRHLLTFLTYYLGVIVFYFLGRKFFQGRYTPLLAAVALVLSPRIFEHSFYNTKDIPCLVFFTLAFFTLFLYLEKRSFLALALHAIACALVIAVRISGMLVFILTIYFLALEMLDKSPNRRAHFANRTGRLALFGLLTGTLVYALWPTLWNDPLFRFAQAVGWMSNYPWGSTTLFLGAEVSMAELPWFYLPLWIAITTPVLYTLLMLIGSVWCAIDSLAGWTRLDRNIIQKRLAVLAWCFGPVLAVILLHSAVYDSWRHVFFIYPAFLLLAFWGFENLWQVAQPRLHQIPLLRYALGGLLAATFVYTGVKMASLHPYEQLYFNRLAGRNMAAVKERFNLDYWGLSYIKGFDYILAHDPRPVVQVKVETFAGAGTVFMLEDSKQERIKIVEDMQKADYYITNYRYELDPGLTGEVYSVDVGGAKILSVYRVGTAP